MNAVLNANNVNVENSLEATTAKFGGFVEAGGVQVRKLQVVGELHLNGINVGGEIGCEFVVIYLMDCHNNNKH